MKRIIEKVIEVVCESYGIPTESIKNGQGKPYNEARMMIYYIVKKVLDVQINNKDLDYIVRNKRINSTISSNIKQFKESLYTNNRLRLKLEDVMNAYRMDEPSLAKVIRRKLSYLININDIDVIKNEIGVIISKINTNTL